LFGVSVFLVILFVPETAYIRTPIQERIIETRKPTDEEKTDVDAISTEKYPRVELAPSSAEKKASYLSTIKFATGRRYSHAPFWKILLRPAVILWYPAVLWAFLIYGTTYTVSINLLCPTVSQEQTYTIFHSRHTQSHSFYSLPQI
jgi:hypothetical protein